MSDFVVFDHRNLPSEKKKKKQLIQDVDELLTELEEQQRIIESLRSMYERQNRELEIYKKQWLASAGAEATPELLKHVQAASACWAASNGRVDLLKNMLENGGDIYQANPDGRTALHMAAAGDQLEAVEFLIKSGAPIHAIDRYGCSPLMEAVDCQHTAVAMSLEIAEALQSVRRLEREYKLGEYIAPGYEIILQTTTIPRLQRKISKLLSNPRSTIPVGQREMPRLIGSASQPSMVTATNTGANAAVPLSMASPPYSGSHGKQASKVLSGNAGATLRKAEKKRTRPSSTFRKLFVDAWLKDNKASKEDDILLHGEPRFTSPRQKKSGSPPAPFGVAFGVLRGTCQVPECDCKFYKKSSAGATCSCGHFPASHLNLGEADMLKGLEHMKMIDERTVTLLVPRDVGVGPDAWPKMLNREVPMDDDTGEVLSQLSRDIVQRQLLIHPDEVVFTRQIGQGSSATVYEGIYKNQKVAIKMINFRPSDKRPREKQRQEIVEEFHIMKAIDDPHVLKFHGVVAQPRLCIVLEYCAMGSLYDVLNRTEEDDAEDIEMDWHTVFRWFTETVEGVAALHSFKHQIVHRDLKSLNLLIDDTLAIKVADFGLSRFLSEEAHQTTLGKLRGTYAYWFVFFYLLTLHRGLILD
jgi:tRNA A-37 threonylcarbamoyl transferase component Bud32